MTVLSSSQKLPNNDGYVHEGGVEDGALVAAAVMFLSDRLNKINVIGHHVSPVFSIADDIVFYESV